MPTDRPYPNESEEEFRARMKRERRRKKLRKHGDDTHDETDHGNWARPGTRATTATTSKPHPDTRVGHFNTAKMEWGRVRGIKGSRQHPRPTGTEAELLAKFKGPRLKMVRAAKTAGKWTQEIEDRWEGRDRTLARALGTDTRTTRRPKTRATDEQLARLATRSERKARSAERRARTRKRVFSQGERKELASEGKAMPHGGFPIKSRRDLRNAIMAFGRSKDKPATKAHIIRRAKALDLTGMIPSGWVLQKHGSHDQSVHGNWSRGGSRAGVTEAGATFTGFIDPETGEVFSMTEARERRRQMMRKHGTQHDEKSHGNWARGGGAGTAVMGNLNGRTVVRLLSKEQRGGTLSRTSSTWRLSLSGAAKALGRSEAEIEEAAGRIATQRQKTRGSAGALGLMPGDKFKAQGNPAVKTVTELGTGFKYTYRGPSGKEFRGDMHMGTTVDVVSRFDDR